jgi:hypothetical protein
MPPSEKVTRVIWIKSGGRCTICREILCVVGASPELSHLIGDVGHIVAEEENGPRGRSPLTVEQRNAESNLLLLCKPHHKMVDDDPATYTVEMLGRAKLAHEEWVRSSLSTYPVWDTKLFQLYYINVPRLSLLASLQGVSINLSRYGRIDALHELGWELNGLMAGFMKVLQTIQLKAIPLDLAIQQEDVKGMLVSFNRAFRTKNIVLPSPGQSFQTLFTGDLKSDPHIYWNARDRKVVMNIDRRWITSTTAFVQFHASGGQNNFAGLGFVNSFDARAKVMNVTPYVIGLPSNPFMEEFYAAMARESARTLD